MNTRAPAWSHWVLRGYPDWLFRLFVLCYAAMSAWAVASCCAA